MGVVLVIFLSLPFYVLSAMPGRGRKTVTWAATRTRTRGKTSPMGACDERGKQGGEKRGDAGRVEKKKRERRRFSFCSFLASTYHAPHQALILDAQQDPTQVRAPPQQAAGQGGFRTGQGAVRASARSRRGEVQFKDGGPRGQGRGVHFCLIGKMQEELGYAKD